MADFSANSLSRNQTNKQWRDVLAGHDGQFHRNRRYWLAEVPAQRAIVV